MMKTKRNKVFGALLVGALLTVGIGTAFGAAYRGLDAAPQAIAFTDGGTGLGATLWMFEDWGGLDITSNNGPYDSQLLWGCTGWTTPGVINRYDQTNTVGGDIWISCWPVDLVAIVGWIDDL